MITRGCPCRTVLTQSYTHNSLGDRDFKKSTRFWKSKSSKRKKTRIGKFRKVFVLGRESGSTHESAFERMKQKVAFAGCLGKGKGADEFELVKRKFFRRKLWGCAEAKSSAERSGLKMTWGLESWPKKWAADRPKMSCRSAVNDAKVVLINTTLIKLRN